MTALAEQESLRELLVEQNGMHLAFKKGTIISYAISQGGPRRKLVLRDDSRLVIGPSGHVTSLLCVNDDPNGCSVLDWWAGGGSEVVLTKVDARDSRVVVGEDSTPLFDAIVHRVTSDGQNRHDQHSSEPVVSSKAFELWNHISQEAREELQLEHQQLRAALRYPRASASSLLWTLGQDVFRRVLVDGKGIFYISPALAGKIECVEFTSLSAHEQEMISLGLRASDGGICPWVRALLALEPGRSFFDKEVKEYRVSDGVACGLSLLANRPFQTPTSSVFFGFSGASVDVKNDAWRLLKGKNSVEETDVVYMAMWQAIPSIVSEQVLYACGLGSGGGKVTIGNVKEVCVYVKEFGHRLRAACRDYGALEVLDRWCSTSTFNKLSCGVGAQDGGGRLFHALVASVESFSKRFALVFSKRPDASRWKKSSRYLIAAVKSLKQ